MNHHTHQCASHGGSAYPSVHASGRDAVTAAKEIPMTSDDHEQHLRRRIEEQEAELEEWRGLARVCGDFLRRVGSSRLSVSDARVRLQAAMEGRLTVTPATDHATGDERDRNARIADAQRAVQGGHLADAITMYEALAQAHPEDTRFLLKLGDCCARAGHVAKATATYFKVAQQYDAQGLFLKAVAVYKQILTVYGRQPEGAGLPREQIANVHYALASMYARLGLSVDACTQYEDFYRLAQEDDVRLVHAGEEIARYGGNPQGLRD